MKRNRLLKRLALVALGVLGMSLSTMADNKPSGLMTDLIEHTDRTWNNGYVSTLPVWKLDAAIEPFQYAAIVQCIRLFHGSFREKRPIRIK